MATRLGNRPPSNSTRFSKRGSSWIAHPKNWPFVSLVVLQPRKEYPMPATATAKEIRDNASDPLEDRGTLTKILTSREVLNLNPTGQGFIWGVGFNAGAALETI